MLKGFTAFCLLLFMSGHVVGQANSHDSKYDSALTACIEQQFKQQDSPKLNEELDLLEVCPDLSILLANRKTKDFIYPPLESDTSLNRLLDERHLREQAYSLPKSTLTELQLASQLARGYDFDSAKAEAPGWWERFKQWLKENYGSEDEDTNIDWLLKLLDGFSIPEWLGDTLFYGSIGLIILFAIIIVVNELRHYKRFKNRDNSNHDSESINPLHQLRTLSWDEVKALPLNEKAGALLQYIIQQCINQQWLPDNKSFTNREFYRAFKAVDANKAEQFNQVINAAEQDIYGNHPLSTEELKQIFQIAEHMLQGNEAISA